MRSAVDTARHDASAAHPTKRLLVQATIALWRTKGFADTTVADICKAAGVVGRDITAEPSMSRHRPFGKIRKIIIRNGRR